MKVLTLQQRLRIIITGFTLVLIVIIGIVVYPNIKSILLLQEEIDRTESFLESQYQRTRRVHRTTTDIDSIVSSATEFTNLTITPDSELQLIQTFEQLAELHTIEQSLNVAYSEKKDPHTNHSYYEFSFLNHGTYENHLQYLDAVLRLPYVVNIQSIDMRRRNTSTQNPTFHEVSLRFSLRIYVK